MRLTDLQVQRLPIPAVGQKTYWEGGFGVRVSQGGSKTFVVMYGKERRLKSLGRYPATSLKAARSAAQHFLAGKVSSRAPKTLSEARTAFLAECEAKNRKSTVTNYTILLNRLTKNRLEDVTRADVPKNAHAIMAAKVFFNWCIRNDLIDRNPFAQERVSYGERSRVLSDAEIKQIWAHTEPPFTDYVKLLLLTGQRKGQFSDFEVRGDTLYFPASIMKGKQEHTIPLLPVAAEFVNALQPFNSWSKAKRRLDKAVPLPHWTIHDLRRTFSTIHASIGTPIHVTEAILAHVSGTVSGVARIYNRYSYLEESRAALAKYEQHIQSIVA